MSDPKTWKVAGAIEDALTGAFEKFDDLIRQAVVTEEEVDAYVVDYKDFYEGWQDWKAEAWE